MTALQSKLLTTILIPCAIIAWVVMVMFAIQTIETFL